MQEATLPNNPPAANNRIAFEFARHIARQCSLLGEGRFSPIDFDGMKHAILEAINQKNYSAAIRHLARLMDEQQNINWYVTNEFLDLPVLIRDARHSAEPNIGVEPYIMMGLSTVRAALALLRSATQNQNNMQLETERYLQILSTSFFQQTINNNNVEAVSTLLANLNSVIAQNISYVFDITFQQALSRLSVAKEFANLEDSAQHIVTLTSLNRQNDFATVFQGELALTRLTAHIIAEYQQRQEKKWYQSLEPWQQKLIGHYLPAILQQNRVIPTQLRWFLIGLKNCYQTINGILNTNTGEFRLTANVFHSGTIIYLGKDADENKRVGILHGEQLKALTGTEKVLTLTLNSSINPTGNDAEIVATTSFIMQSMRCFHTNLPLNAARRISTNDYSGIAIIFNIVAKVILPMLEENLVQAGQKLEHNFFRSIGNYLYVMEFPDEEIPFIHSKVETLYTFIRNPQYPSENKQLIELVEIVELGLYLRFILQNTALLNDPDNQNLKIACYLNLLVSRLSLFYNIAIHSACESGKDRTGLLMFRTAAISFSKVLFNRYTFLQNGKDLDRLMSFNIINLAYARHYQFLAGIQGGTTGAFGIKKDSKGAIPEKEFPQPASNALIEQTASYNKTLIFTEELVKCYYFPILTTDIKIQKTALIHVLHVNQGTLRAFQTGSTTLSRAQRFSSLFFNLQNLSQQIQMLDRLIANIEATRSLPDLRETLDRHLQSTTTTNTALAVVDINLILSVTLNNLSRSSESVVEQPVALSNSP